MKNTKLIGVIILLSIVLNLVLPIHGYAKDSNTINKNETINEENINNKSEKNDSDVVNNVQKKEDNDSFKNEETAKEEKSETNEVIKNEDDIKEIESNLKSTTINQTNTSIENTSIQQTLENGEYKIKSAKNTSKVLSVVNGSTSNEAKIELTSDKGLLQNKFNITYLEDGYYKIESIISGRVLDVPGGSSELETKIQQYSYNGTDAQKWIIKDSGDGTTYNIISKCNDLYIDLPGGSADDGTQLQMYKGNNTIAQKFVFEKIEHEIGTQTISNGMYKIKSVKDTSKAISVENSSTKNEAKIELTTDKNMMKSRFKITYLGEGYYKIESMTSGKVLDVPGRTNKLETKIQQYDYNGTDAQKWIIKASGDGITYNIISKCNDLYIDLPGGSVNDGTQLQIYKGNNTIAQKFIFQKIEHENGTKTINDGIYKIKSAKDINKAISIKDKSKDNSANIELDTFNNKEKDNIYQKFKVEYLGDGYYKIESVLSGKVLDVPGASTEFETKLQQYSYNGTDAQKWIIKETGEETYSIISKCNDLYWDLPGGRTENGTQLQMYEGNKTIAQKFIFEKEEEKKQTIADGIYAIRSVKDLNKVMSVENGSMINEAKIQLSTYKENKYQKFKVEYLGDGYYKIQSLKSYKVLDVPGGTSELETKIQQYDYNGTDAQKWIIKETGEGTYNIISKCNGLYVDLTWGITDDGTKFQMYTGNGTEAQDFLFETTTPTALDNGIYEIETVLKPNMVLDISAGSNNNCANVQLWAKDNVNQQKFRITHLENGYYKIEACHSKKVLDVDGGQSNNGTNVQQYEYNQTDAQKWYIEDLGDGTYTIKSKCNGLYLDINAGGTSNGTNVQVYEGNGTKAQIFKINETTISADNSFDFKYLDDLRYPNFKNMLQSLQNKYPNWTLKIVKTGLDWESVIENEDMFSGTEPKSLTQETGEWRNGNAQYDVSKDWYRASKNAIKYMMDPRNSLEDKWVFQFQNLSSSSGTREEIKKMVTGTFLDKDSIIDTIIETSREQGISPFHIVSRIVQEQGNDGSGIMNGYEINQGDTTYKVYNLFNINVCGENGILAGAKLALSNGWFTPEASIRYGTSFLKANYIGRGQNTLYFQKYNVITKPLYENQFMQNIKAANTEGNIIYNAYKKSEILESHFEFLIPVYENMPATICQRPSN